MTYRLLNTAGLDSRELMKYYRPMWFQYSYNEETGKTEPIYYQAINCMDTSYVREQDLTEQTKNEIFDQMCADRDFVRIQNGDQSKN